LGKSKEKTKADPGITGRKAIQAYAGSILKDLHTLSEKVVLERVLEHPAPREIVQRLPKADFFWLVKRTGEEGSLQLLRLASTEQWEYLLDLELWHKDRLDMEEASLWLRRLQLADPERLTGWLFTGGQALAYYYLFRSIQVEMRDEDEVYDLEEGFVTLDGLFYIRVSDPDRMATIEGMLRYMADADFLRYQALLSGLAGVLPTELEEDMYRMKNIRLAEHGFLPPEEALPVYAPLEPDVLKSDEGSGRMPEDMNEDVLDLAPYAPLSLLEGPNLLTISLSRIRDAHFLDRFRLEFAGLCNQVLSADGLPTQEVDVLERTCRKSAGYMNLLLEKMCGDDMAAAEALLRNNPLISLFRAGFGLAQKLKWESEQWIKKSWFRQAGFSLSFWGEEWGYTVAGLTAKRPLFCDRHAENREYRDFEHATDLTEAGKILHRLMALDTLLGHLAGMHPLDPEADRTDDLTFHPLIFTFWARRMLHLTPSFKGISLNQAKKLFRLLRRGGDRPPYQMLGFEEVFVKDFMATASGFDAAAAATLKETLSLIWQAFSREYEQVPVDALDRRFSPYIMIRTSPRSPVR